MDIYQKKLHKKKAPKKIFYNVNVSLCDKVGIYTI